MHGRREGEKQAGEMSTGKSGGICTAPSTETAEQDSGLMTPTYIVLLITTIEESILK
jgi:hypothetical protein